MRTDQITKGALIGALYAVLTVGLSPLSFGPLQFRLSEMLKPFLFRSRINLMGLVIGMIVSNMFSPLGLLDTLFMPLIVLSSGLFAYHISNRKLACLLMSVNTSMGVSVVLAISLRVPMLLTFFYVLVSELLLYFIGEYVISLYEKRGGKM